MLESMEINLKAKPFYLNEAQDAHCRELLSSMTLRQKAGQVFVILGDACPEEERKKLVSEYAVGGVLLRPAPLWEIREKFAALDRVAAFPLLHCANLEEGGAGIVTDGTYFGTQLQVAAADDESVTRHFAAVCAIEGRAAGVDWTFSPVVDIDRNFRNPITNLRTFGSDCEKVRRHAAVVVEELQKQGVAAACKHFPGDGVDWRDQHLHPTYNSLSADEWYATYGSIYRTLIDEGLLSVMAGHIVQPQVIRAVNPEAGEEDLLPGSLSREMLTGVLRGEFGFNGVIITDATIMGGYTMAMERRRAIPHSIQAGCDMLCFSTDIYEDIRYLEEGVRDGLLSEERLDAAVLRVLALKEKVRAMRAEAADRLVGVRAAEADTAGRELQRRLEEEADHPDMSECAYLRGAWARDCADRAVTLVKDTARLVPALPCRFPRIRLVTVGSDALFDGSLRQCARAVLENYGFEVEDYEPMADDLHGTSGLDTQRLTLILANYPTASNQVTVRPQWCEKHALEIPRFVHEESSAFISFGNPYHLQDVPRIRTYINAYSATRATVEAALEKLIGVSEFKGVSPVDAFCGLEDTRL